MNKRMYFCVCHCHASHVHVQICFMTFHLLWIFYEPIKNQNNQKLEATAGEYKNKNKEWESEINEVLKLKLNAFFAAACRHFNIKCLSCPESCSIKYSLRYFCSSNKKIQKKIVLFLNNGSQSGKVKHSIFNVIIITNILFFSEFTSRKECIFYVIAIIQPHARTKNLFCLLLLLPCSLEIYMNNVYYKNNHSEIEKTIKNKTQRVCWMRANSLLVWNINEMMLFLSGISWCECAHFSLLLFSGFNEWWIRSLQHIRSISELRNHRSCLYSHTHHECMYGIWYIYKYITSHH